MTSDLTAVTAHHEAGHAVAAVMRGGSALTGISVHNDGTGLTNHRSHTWDGPFIAYGGLWAEARFGWPADVPVTAEDEDGCVFGDHVTAVWLTQPDDAAIVLAKFDHLEGLGTDLRRTLEAGTLRTWDTELEAVWPVVQWVAARLLDGHTPGDESVREAVEARWVTA